MSAIPPNAYKPFGTGQRACIGRQFALQEAVLVLGMLLQRFELIKDPNYRLHTKVTLTVKPADFYVQVRRRADRPIDKAEPITASSSPDTKPRPFAINAHHTPLAVLFGSNLGTAEGIATRLAQEGTDRGYDVTLGSLDDYVVQLPAKAALIICSSYNGLPLDNAVKFHHWVDEAAQEAFDDLSYTVFGCGNTEWASTYQAVPTELDAGLDHHGGTRIHPRGAGDVRGDFDAAYRNWHDTLWQDIAAALGVEATPETDESQPRLSITVTNRQVTNPVIMSYHAKPQSYATIISCWAPTLAVRLGTLNSPCRRVCSTKQATTSEYCRATTSTSSDASCCSSVWTPAPISRSFRTAATTHICPPMSPRRFSASWAVASSSKIRQPAATLR
jgi:cytochrome P450/NADPH-cytochrome P450 reductase